MSLAKAHHCLLLSRCQARGADLGGEGGAGVGAGLIQGRLALTYDLRPVCPCTWNPTPLPMYPNSANDTFQLAANFKSQFPAWPLAPNFHPTDFISQHTLPGLPLPARAGCGLQPTRKLSHPGPSSPLKTPPEGMTDTLDFTESMAWI